RLWKQTSPEKEAALIRASEVPEEIVDLCLEALNHLPGQIPSTSPHLVSDLAEAGILLAAASESAALNVEINLSAFADASLALHRREALKKKLEKIRVVSGEVRSAFNPARESCS
ncbi:MAG: cyclodeaminase/cyclohydrolase family protein, partial [Candidatus Omnitrophica bacterium]|nr:cyclodeaminase/cyclohydrolase family protein [Candidatus Omnitrophota bacterium]